MEITATFSPPAEGEFAPFYAGYVALASKGDLLRRLEAQIQEVSGLLRGLSEEEALFRYAPGKWSVKEVAGHLADTERIMAYRALRIARGDTTPLPGFDENSFVATAGFDARPLPLLVEEWETVRRASILLLRGFDGEAAAREGTASGAPITARALAYIIAGHVAHHLEILRTRYSLG
ncbi:MAG TPA: DinB family protein [Longimicrobium sp.]